MVDSINISLNFVGPEFEQQVLNLVPEKAKSGLDRNQVIRYGSPVPYNRWVVSQEIPEIFHQFHKHFEFDSVTINEYFEGQWIPFHIDKPDGGPCIRVISLLSDAEILFRETKRSQPISIDLPRYSLITICEDARYIWEHSLKAKAKRYSIVFRDSSNMDKELQSYTLVKEYPGSPPLGTQVYFAYSSTEGGYYCSLDGLYNVPLPIINNYTFAWKKD